MKHSTKFFVGSIIVLVFFAVTLFAVSRMFGSSDEYLGSLDTQTVIIGDQSIKVFIADTPTLQARGLSRVPALPVNTGMIFTFLEAHIPQFWMKDMQFALDMIWLDESLTIIDIHQNVAPETYPETFSPMQPAVAVIEVAAGTVSELGIGVGDSVTIN